MGKASGKAWAIPFGLRGPSGLGQVRAEMDTDPINKAPEICFHVGRSQVVGQMLDVKRVAIKGPLGLSRPSTVGGLWGTPGER